MNKAIQEAVICLVSVKHPTDIGAPIPFLGIAGVFTRITLPKWQADAIKEMGFDVEIHEVPYDPVAASNIAALELREQLNLGAGEDTSEADVPDADASADEPGVPVAGEIAAKTVEPEPAPTPPAPAVEVTQPATEQQSTEQSTEQSAEDEVVEGASEEDVAALRAQITALTTVKAAKELVAEYGVELPEGVTKLEAIKAYLLEQMDAPAA